ncbi:hypothetical protein [Candidatus Pelagisphaera phototrophica]|uniref:hypothetical protein n=1 Tax=Candidatus Pelagisphaera phototrophica TaxID=2684113 RepID=UPI0019FDD54E|nr:hypothetical protein [Candidatus Pelagisphaera phototrophica]QXD33627.1 hypothetical protein GA004_08030 [Candidatus Pelagisphaera phototrophica]
MNFIEKYKQKGWSFEFGYDDAYQIENLERGEITHKKIICKLSEKNFNDYINKTETKELINKFDKKTVLIVNGEIRNASEFIKWADKIKNYTDFYFYTDKSSFLSIHKSHRDFLEKISSGFCFSEEDEFYQEALKKVKHQNNMLQWLKFKQSLYKWKKEWQVKGFRTILRMRSDIAFLNPYLLEYNIKQGFLNSVSKGNMLLRSDIIFAFDIEDTKLLADFYDEIFSFYLSEDWINYPYIPLNPDFIIRAKGSTRIEWNNFPTKYIGINPSKNMFFERICCYYQELKNDFKNYSFIKNNNSEKRLNHFGNLSSVRNQPSKIFASERCFAHYLVSKGINSTSHNHLFSGKLIRKRVKKIRIFKNFLILNLKRSIKFLVTNETYNSLKKIYIN